MSALSTIADFGAKVFVWSQGDAQPIQQPGDASGFEVVGLGRSV